ncbi:MAG: class I SAM-dependent methyltransferase [Candidatus Omnitrophica bacterium]|jgi:SAM-dependent methyltransferase|nr:class I SAM-dependent methyltransferase [Candidatus Omnitrophota bacterium]
MKYWLELAANPLFILKKLQIEALSGYSGFIKGRVLDIGCGLRPYARYLRAKIYVGIDILAEVKPDIRSRCDPLPFKDGSFDSVICTEVLEHILRPQACLAQINKALKKGGIVYITVPQSWCLHYEPDDYWRFTRYGIETLVKEAGFEIVAMRRIGGVFSLAGVRLVDVAWTVIRNCLGSLGGKFAEQAATALCLGFSLLFYILAKLGDGIDQRDALGWAVLAKK